MAMRWKGAIGAALVAALIGGWMLLLRRGSAADDFETAAVRRGDITVSISATGTVEPEEVIDVGAQVAGRVLSFGIDAEGRTVDYGSRVDEGTVLAKIDASLYEADVKRAEAELSRTKAELDQLRAKLGQAQSDWERAQKLAPSNALAQAGYDGFKFGHDIALANVAVGQANYLQTEADLRKAKQNLEYCTIVSPVKGVVIDRRVNIGQTVVSSLNAPSLFLIAKDLRRMQVWAAVNEADIGSIRTGQPVNFSVDAFPGDSFYGEVKRIRLNASMVQNVVTYTVEINTDNANGRLLPYLTANVKFIVTELKDVLYVPNAALRWTPGDERAVSRDEPGGEMEKRAGTSLVLVLKQGTPYPLRLTIGQTDGTSTEVRDGGIAAGDLVIVGEKTKAEDASSTRSPLTPQFPRGRTRG